MEDFALIENFALMLYTAFLLALIIPLVYISYRRERDLKAKLNGLQSQIDDLKRELEEVKKC
ncbi:MAG: hypothetical protein FWG73_05125 [Planctomycetaceae bacterium]|nr:hypothetical protein [Planctomycetaceae bacterium]